MSTEPVSVEPRSTDTLRAKDLIVLGVFGLIFFIATMIAVGIASLSVVDHLLGPALSAIPSGIVWTHMRVRVPKAWAMLIPGVLCGIIMFLIGTGWPIMVAFIIGSVLAEMCSRVGEFKSFRWSTIGFALVAACFTLGEFLPMLVMPDYYLELMSASSRGVEYGRSIMDTMNPGILLGLLVAAFACGIVGCLL
ncbi:MptD family putative ECF transporter S component [uncultured Propionibacterium sp.]|uniref:MptD family putative ECF transporter S component n=1 Tax=uncultured Propionibacterium sp. TaxID=218066 RepID=UPI00292EE81C|nr:MptD family putative ECF transporter S component [uncultured Propionibacterium sp.]